MPIMARHHQNVVCCRCPLGKQNSPCMACLMFVAPPSVTWFDHEAITITAARQHTSAILFYRCSLDLIILFSPPNFRASLADRHQTLPHVRRWPRFIKFGQKFGWPLPPKFRGRKTSKFRRDFAQHRDLIANISGTQQDIVNRKTALQTTDTPAQTNLIRFTLVHKRRKIGPEFWSTQRAAIRLGIATHLVMCKNSRPAFTRWAILSTCKNVQGTIQYKRVWNGSWQISELRYSKASLFRRFASTL